MKTGRGWLPPPRFRPGWRWTYSVRSTSWAAELSTGAMRKGRVWRGDVSTRMPVLNMDMLLAEGNSGVVRGSLLEGGANTGGWKVKKDKSKTNYRLLRTQETNSGCNMQEKKYRTSYNSLVSIQVAVRMTCNSTWQKKKNELRLGLGVKDCTLFFTLKKWWKGNMFWLRVD